jgi:hypothetical protein
MRLGESKFREFLYEVQHAANLFHVLNVWMKFSEHLAGVDLIYSHPDPVGTPLPVLSWPHELFRDGGLRPFFAGPYLYFINNQIITRMVPGERVEVKVDYSISLDTNAASYVEDFVNNNRTNVPAGFIKAMEFMLEHRPNFDYSFYLMENTPNYRDPAKAVRIRQKLIAIQKLDYADRDHYKRTGEVKALVSDAQLEALTDVKLHQFYVRRQAERGAFSYEHWHDILYVMLLKIIEYCRRSKVPLERKIEQLFDFMHEEMNAYFDRLTVVALKLFENRNSLTFFNPLNKGGSARNREGLRNTIRGMAWDLTLIRILEQLSATKMGGDYFVPLFLSSDQKMLKLFDTHPLLASVAHGGEGQVVPLPRTDTTRITAQIMGEGFIKKYFDEDVVRRRLSKSREAFESAPRRLLPALEGRVLDFLSGE